MKWWVLSVSLFNHSWNISQLFFTRHVTHVSISSYISAIQSSLKYTFIQSIAALLCHFPVWCAHFYKFWRYSMKFMTFDKQTHHHKARCMRLRRSSREIYTTSKAHTNENTKNTTSQEICMKDCLKTSELSLGSPRILTGLLWCYRLFIQDEMMPCFFNKWFHLIPWVTCSGQ